MRALVFERFGGPEVLGIRELPAPSLEPGTARVRMRAIGVNFADVYRRRGDYHLDGEAPFILGYEGAGEIEAVDATGADAELARSLPVGTRVGFADVPRANAEQVVAPLEKLIVLPDDVAFATAAALLLQGLTAQYLVRDSFLLTAGQSALIHAAGGGVGQLLVQMARLLGARVLGLASSEDKRDAARAAGAEQVSGYEEWLEDCRRFAPSGVDVVYDSVGSTLLQSLQAARVGGAVVFFGMAGGSPPAVDPRILMDRSQRLIGGDLWNVLTSHRERAARAGELFGWLRDGRLRVRIDRCFALAEGAQAHAFLESRRAIGKVLILVD